MKATRRVALPRVRNADRITVPRIEAALLFTTDPF